MTTALLGVADGAAAGAPSLLRTQVLVAGGGPVGLATAVELDSRKIDCVVVEPSPQFVLEELLREAVAALPTCRLATGYPVTAVDQDDASVIVRVEDQDGKQLP